MNRQIPFDLNSERATLGSILLERDVIITIASWLIPDYFYLEKHAWVYEAMLACYHQRIPPDLSTVAAELRRHERLEPIGGISYLGELSAAVPTAVHIEHYARIVERTALLRRLIEVGGKITALGYDEREDLEVTLNKAEAELYAVSQQRAQQDFVHIGQVLDGCFDQLSAVQEDRDKVAGLQTAFHGLDSLTGGLHRSDLIVVAARPGAGKTSLALSIAYNVGFAGQKVGIFSLEMSREQLAQRLLAMHTGIDSHRLRTHNIREEEFDLLVSSMGELSNLPIYIEDTPALSVLEVRSKARKLDSQGKISLLIVDYLQLMQGRKNNNRVQEVSEISQGLKTLARELNVPVIAVSQLSRAVEGRQSHIPMLSDLRESGSIEQDADLVMFIYREELYDKETEKKGLAEIYIAKHRNGPLGVTTMRFDAQTTLFSDLAYYPPDEA